MAKFEDILRSDPNAESKIKKAQETIKTIEKMRAAGFAKGPSALKAPHAGRYDLSGSPKVSRGRAQHKRSDDV